MSQQIRQIKGVVLEVTTERISKVAFCKILTYQKLEEIKLPTIPEKYKLTHLLQPNYLIDFEVVLTRKNWILTSIYSFNTIVSPKNYEEYLLYFKQIEYIKNHLKVEQNTHILPLLIQNFDNDNFLIKSFSNKNPFKWIDQAMGY